MPDSKITALTALTAADPAVDMFPVVDVSDTTMAASGTTKRISINNILACSPAATLASLNVTGSSIPANGLYLPTTNTLEFAANSLAQYRIAPLGVFSWYDGVGGTRMTLNATGLGVGASPAQKLTVAGSAEITGGVVGQGALIGRDGSSGGANYGSNTGNTSLNAPAGGSVRFNVNNGTFAGVFDANANLGIGVTPSAYGAGIKGLDLGAWTSVAQIGAASFYGFNSYASTTGQFNYKNSGAIASGYFQTTSGHLWLNAPSNAGAAGANATFTTAMTLTAGGDLLVGKTVNNITTVGFQSTSTGEVSAALAASTNAATQWTTYSTGAAAYRFYVGMAGTVFATNTTISAISDARLKENVQDLDVGLNEVLALKPRKFDWKAGKGKNIKGDRGFIAQEFETVFPNLIDEWADPAPEGEAPYKSVRADLIPVLVKAIQELTARVQTLEAK